jgi:NAD(P)-dependent dehydrogenase (short-subunit alcohol dehydrogenase family)
MPANPFDMSGRVAIVTGSSKGLGKASAVAMAAQGAKVVITGRKEDLCRSVADAINADPGSKTGEAIPVACNISRKEELRNLVDTAVARWGKVDVVMCNAAIHPWMGSVTRLPDESFEKFFRANVQSAIWLSQMTVPQMAERGWGRFIVVSSLSGMFGDPHTQTYGLTKAALLQLVRGLAAEFASRGVSSNAIVPGTYRTDMAKPVLENKEWMRIHDQRNPSRRLGEPEEIAGLAVLLASPAASFINGQSICADGGYSISYE